MKTVLVILLTLLSLQITAQTESWTITTLKEYVDQQNKFHDQRFDLLDVAIIKQENAYNERFANTNEWRSSYEDLIRQMQTLIQTMRNDYIPRTELVSVERQLSELKTKIEKYETLKTGGSNTLFIVIAIISSLAAALAFSRNFIASVYRQSKT